MDMYMAMFRNNVQVRYGVHRNRLYDTVCSTSSRMTVKPLLIFHMILPYLSYTTVLHYTL
jgi:hypothetical protein